MNLVEDIEEVIERYLLKNRYHTLHTLARKSGIGYTTIRRLAQKEAGRPNADTVINLIDAALPPPERVTFLKKHFPKISNMLEDVYNNQSFPSTIDSISDFLRKSLHSFIFNLAATANGTTIDDIKRLKGEHGLKALDELILNEILIRDRKNRIFYKTKGWNTANADIILDQIKFSAEYFDKALLGTDAARMAHITASVNSEALKKVHDLCTKFFYDLTAIQKDPDNQGNIPMFVDMMMNVLDAHYLPKD